MGHVRQKKSTSSSTSTPPEPLAIEFVNLKEHPRENRYPEQLNAEELISQINCSRNSNCNNNSNAHHNNNSHNLLNINNSNDVRNSNDSNNNSHAVNSSVNHQQQQQQQRRESIEVDDIEKGSDDQDRSYRQQKSLFRRLYSFIRSLWIGAKFNVGKAGKFHINLLKGLRC